MPKHAQNRSASLAEDFSLELLGFLRRLRLNIAEFRRVAYPGNRYLCPRAVLGSEGRGEYVTPTLPPPGTQT
jgi:hypothetical protein